jgi:phage baseplate assembly protein W
MPGFSPSLPLQNDNSDGFALTKTHYEVAKQNLKNLILTNPGEKVMDPNFGVGLRTFVFEQNHATTYKKIEEKLKSQVKKFLPYLEITNVLFEPGSGAQVNLLNIKVSYFIKVLNFSDELDILSSI